MTQPLAALQYCSCTAGRNSQFTQPRLRCHVTETLPVFAPTPQHTHTGQYNFSHFYLPLLLHSEKTNRQQQQEIVMAQPGKRKPSLVWEFFEKLDDGSGKCQDKNVSESPSPQFPHQQDCRQLQHPH